jgi:hypothetical protein
VIVSGAVGHWEAEIMRWLLAAAALGLLTANASAGVLTCDFTEPFFNITFDSTTGIVTRVSADDTDPDTGKPIPRILARDARLELLENVPPGQKFRLVSGSETLLEMQITGQADNGMSESLYPIKGLWGRLDGGCYTEKYQPFDPYELLQDLGLKL